MGGVAGVGGVAAIVGLGAMRWGGAGVSRFPLRPAEALEWRAAMARVDAWKRVQEERRPQLDASSQRRVAPLGFPGGQGLATMLPCELRLCLPQLIAHAQPQDLAPLPPFLHSLA